MTPSFTRGEYWLLDAVVEFRIGLDYVAAPNVKELLNRASHGLNREMLLAALMNLIQKGLIETRHLGLTVIPDEKDISIAFDSHHTHRFETYLEYGLTSEGGRQWEMFALPDWNLYIDVTGSVPDHTVEIEQVEILSMNKKWLERYFELSQDIHVTFEQSSVQWDMVKPWQSTYWKMLPFAHRVQYFHRSFEHKTDIINQIDTMSCMRNCYYAPRF